LIFIRNHLVVDQCF